MFCRCLKSKKGFTLVELMVVVVIMGILVAVAVPVYSVVTKNARTKTCHSNCELLEKAAVQYMTGNDSETVDGIANDGITFNDANPITIATEDEFQTKLSQKYIDNLENPPKIFDSGCQYVFYYENSGKSVRVYCVNHGDKAGTHHN